MSTNTPSTHSAGESNPGSAIEQAVARIYDAAQAKLHSLEGSPDNDRTHATNIAAEALKVPGVLGLSDNLWGSVLSALPGNKAAGVSVTEDKVTVSLIVRLNEHMRSIADAVRHRVEQFSGKATDVVIGEALTNEEILELDRESSSTPHQATDNYSSEKKNTTVPPLGPNTSNFSHSNKTSAQAGYINKQLPS